VINGQKVFISDGHFATWHMVSAYRDKKDPLNTGMGLIVKTGQPGFEVVKHEHKMGQRACPASTLVFEDCFVPDRDVISDLPEFFERILFVLGTSRVGVAAIGTGCARGAFEQAVKAAKTARYKGRFLIDEQWVQQILADMLANVMVGRALYISAGFCESKHGMMQMLSSPAMEMFQKMVPDFLLLSPAYQKVLRSKVISKIMNKALSAIEIRRRQRGQAHSSIAKYYATDLAMRNANLGLEIAGAAGLEHSAGIEKIFRDAKLLQIYEGTNQINRKHVWDSIIARRTTM
jgi:alkylation response protein AidB-like acyl-CoA dehydrogenase